MSKLARVCVEGGPITLDREFYYSLPKDIADRAKIGQAVTVPFGKLKKTGIIIGFTEEETQYKIKDIIKINNLWPVVGPTEIELAGYMQKRYVASFYDCLKLMCPPNFFGKSDVKIKLNTQISPENSKQIIKGSKNLERILSFIEDEGGETTEIAIKAFIGKNAASYLNILKDEKLIVCEEFTKRQGGSLKRKYIRLLPSFEEKLELIGKRATSQLKAIEALKEGEIELSSCCDFGFSRSSADELCKKGIAEIYEKDIRRNPFSHKNIKYEKKLTPTEEQKKVLDGIEKMLEKETKDTVLLHGVTGSGKTEVFMQVIERVLEQGKTAIVLVPEISLTPQMADRFLGRFGEKIAILHSVLSNGERYDEWMRIKNGEAKIVIGARSAVFAPVSDIGVIIVDEEHESTYKSEQSPRYDTLEIAKKRCEQNNALLILASATPSVADYYKAKNGEYKLLEMTKRYNNISLPNIEVSDMREELRSGNRSMLSRLLQKELSKNLENGEQSIMFLNKRGFSSFVSCRDCGFVVSCPDCSVALTYHKATESLNCHYCGYKTEVMQKCPECKGNHIKYFGTGTQRLEEEIKKIFPKATVIRMDVDSTVGKNSHEKILKKFSDEKIDVLLGTQMVSKGLDFPGISLVGVVAADMSLNLSDYRASERTFNLITQVCGRSGRGNSRGRAVIQTYSPENPVIEMAKAQDYKSFYESEIAYREMFSYPPFSDIVCVSFSSENVEEVKKACIETEKACRQILSGKNITYYNSSEAPLSKIKGRYRWRFWFKTSCDEDLRDKMRDLYLGFNNKEVRMSISFNPESMI